MKRLLFILFAVSLSFGQTNAPIKNRAVYVDTVRKWLGSDVIMLGYPRIGSASDTISSRAYARSVASAGSTPDTTFFITRYDTVAMLNGRFAKDTLSLSSRIDGKQATIPNIADTSTYVQFMDSSGTNGWYKRAYVDALLNAKQNTIANLADTSKYVEYADTTARIAMQWELDGKLNIADTATFRTASNGYYAPKIGSTNITTLGTIGTGVWNGTSIDTAYTNGVSKITGGYAITATKIAKDYRVALDSTLIPSKGSANVFTLTNYFADITSSGTISTTGVGAHTFASGSSGITAYRSGGSASLNLATYGGINGSFWYSNAYAGTFAAPSQITSSQILGNYMGAGYINGALRDMAKLQFRAKSTPSSSNYSSYGILQLVPDSSTTLTTHTIFDWVLQQPRVTIGATAGTGTGNLYIDSLYLGTTLALDASRNAALGAITGTSLNLSGVGTIGSKPNLHIGSNGLLYKSTDTSATGGGIPYSDTTSVIAMQWELDGKVNKTTTNIGSKPNLHYSGGNIYISTDTAASGGAMTKTQILDTLDNTGDNRDFPRSVRRHMIYQEEFIGKERAVSNVNVAAAPAAGTGIGQNIWTGLGFRTGTGGSQAARSCQYGNEETPTGLDSSAFGTFYIDPDSTRTPTTPKGIIFAQGAVNATSSSNLAFVDGMIFRTRMKFGSATDTIGMFVGIGVAQAFATANVNTHRRIGFEYGTSGVGSLDSLYGVVSDGTTMQRFGVTKVAASTWYSLEWRRVGANIQFYLNDALVFTLGTNVPAQTTGGAIQIQGWSFDFNTALGNNKLMTWDYIEVSRITPQRR